MKKYILTIILLCPVMILRQKCEGQEINPGHLYHEEMEALERISKERLFDVLEEDASEVYTDCFRTEENPDDLDDL